MLLCISEFQAWPPPPPEANLQEMFLKGRILYPPAQRKCETPTPGAEKLCSAPPPGQLFSKNQQNEHEILARIYENS